MFSLWTTRKLLLSAHLYRDRDDEIMVCTHCLPDIALSP